MADRDLLEWAVKCRLAGGVPTVRTRFAGERLRLQDGRRVVIASCYGAADEVPGGVFEVSEELFEELDRREDDWRLLLKLAEREGLA